MYCPTCGSDNQFEGRFCRRCGASLEAVSLALSGKGKEPAADKSQLTQLLKDYYSGRHEMIGGLGAVFVGIAIPATILALGWGGWGFFWIFIWIFMGLFGNGVHQFNKGWKKWNEASCDLKALGYDVPPTKERRHASHLPNNDSGMVEESRGAEPLQLSGPPAPPSVTESTTRHLEIDKSKPTH